MYVIKVERSRKVEALRGSVCLLSYFQQSNYLQNWHIKTLKVKRAKGEIFAEATVLCTRESIMMLVMRMPIIGFEPIRWMDLVT